MKSHKILSTCFRDIIDIIEEFSKVFIMIDALDEITVENTTSVLIAMHYRLLPSIYTDIMKRY